MWRTPTTTGEVYRHQGDDYEKAMFHYNSAISIYRPALGDSHGAWPRERVRQRAGGNSDWWALWLQ